MEREKLGSRLGFILLSAGCAIGCGNVWKFPYLCGKNGGGAFVLIYLVCLVLLGLPVMTIEFALGRASQKSPIRMYQELEPKGTRWHVHGKFAFVGNLALMMFYTSVAGWILYYFFKSSSGSIVGLTNTEVSAEFDAMMANPLIMWGFMAIVVVLGFFILSFSLQGGLEKVTKYMMVALLVLMLILVANSFTLEKAKEGLAFYLVPDFSKIDGSVIAAAMNQAFFTLSLGIGSMAIFGSYIGKERSLMGETVNVILLDTAVALMAGLIIFPATATYGVDNAAGPSLLFVAMNNVFANMRGGAIWGTLFFLFMFFAAMSTVLAVFENILAMVRETTGWGRKKACAICCVGMLVLATPCALGYNVLSGIEPIGAGTTFLDVEDFIVSYILLPLGSVTFVIFTTIDSKFTWGWDNFLKEANAGEGLKVPRWMKWYTMIFVPIFVAIVFIVGLKDFDSPMVYIIMAVMAALAVLGVIFDKGGKSESDKVR